ncbi:MAG: phosphotransferase [Tepidisphaeraceae bacterium]
MTSPTAHDAERIARRVLGESIAAVARFPTGAGNWVYDVEASSGRRVVVRINRRRDECEAGVYWSRTLRSLGVPLPEQLQHFIPDSDDQHAWTVLYRFPGTDLGNVYPTLTDAEKLGVLDQVMQAQKIVHKLPPGRGFGYVARPGTAPHRDWAAVIDGDLERSRRRIKQVGVVQPDRVDRVRRCISVCEFAAVRPTAFLDDTTTRNVIVHDGVFQGIVDVDGICYGDPLLVPALTRMSLLSSGYDTLYTDAWFERLRPTPERRRRYDFYTAVFCVNFLSELGQQFNLDAPPAVDPDRIARLEAILDMLLKRL